MCTFPFYIPKKHLHRHSHLKPEKYLTKQLSTQSVFKISSPYEDNYKHQTTWKDSWRKRETSTNTGGQLEDLKLLVSNLVFCSQIISLLDLPLQVFQKLELHKLPVSLSVVWISEPFMQTAVTGLFYQMLCGLHNGTNYWYTWRHTEHTQHLMKQSTGCCMCDGWCVSSEGRLH